MRQKILSPSTWSLKAQIGLSLLFALIILTQFVTLLVTRTETRAELADLEARSHHTVLLTSAMLSMEIKRENITGLEDFVTQTFLHDPNVSFVSITGPDGSTMLSLGDSSTQGREGFITFSDPLAYSIGYLGEVSVTWDTTFINEVIRAQIRQTRILINSFMITLGLLIFIGGQFLIFRPLSILDERIQDLRGGKQNIFSLPPLSENQTREWSQLTQSTNLLQIAIIEKEQRENDLLLARDIAVETSQIQTNLLTNISHEFRTPLNGILGLSELLLTTEMDEEQQDYAESILESGNNLLETVTGMLDLSTLESGDLECNTQTFELVGIIQTVVDEHQPTAAEKELPFSFQPDADLPTEIQSDPKMISKIVSNLIDNAIRFTDKGAVAVTLYSTPISETDQQVTISVVDTGIGIPQDQHERIFDSFTQADSSLTRSHEGNGLGLAISKGLAQKLGGEILVQSELGIGSTFTFSFTAPLMQTKNKKSDPEVA